MCGNEKGSCEGGVCKGGCKCTPVLIAKILVIVGGVNWGLVGLGMLLGGSGWNVVNMVLGSVPVLEAIVYVLVGVAAVMSIFGCKCKKCMGEASCCSAEAKKEPVQG